MALDAKSETFVVHVAIRKWEKMPVHSKKQAQVGALLFNKASTKVLVEYSNYSNIFSAENVAELSKYTGINDHVIKLEEGKQSPFGLFYSLESEELKTLKTYIKTNLTNAFIRPSKSSVRVLIFFDQKPDRSFCFCVDY